MLDSVWKLPMLQPGDLLLWKVGPGANLLDRLIGWGESKIGQVFDHGRQYYHVATVSADITLMYSAQPPKIDLYPIPTPLPPYIEIRRLKAGVTPEGLYRVFDYLESRRGRWYDFLGVLTFGMIEVGGLEFCSQLTEDGWMKYPVEISPDSRWTTPDDIAFSDAFITITS
jgi:hypothetical protein